MKCFHLLNPDTNDYWMKLQCIPVQFMMLFLCIHQQFILELSFNAGPSVLANILPTSIRPVQD